MRFSAEEIRRIQFRVSRRGYDPKEVDDFIQAVAEDYSRIQVVGNERSSSPEIDPSPILDLGSHVEAVLSAAVGNANDIVKQAQHLAAELLQVAEARKVEIEAVADDMLKEA